MKKIIFITPHLSTGGLPQFLLDKIGVLFSNFEIYLIEYQDITGGVLVVQRNRLKNLLKDRFFTLGENKEEIITIIKNIEPDIIHFEEFSETFVDHKILNEIYLNKSYKITETTHGTGFDKNQKYFIPDKILFVSKGNFDQYNSISDCEVLEFPVRFKRRTEGLLKLGLDPMKKHILNVGLFTPGKNQKEAFELAREVNDDKIIFHFVGNQASNFENYWGPLMKEKPENCVVWGERDDTENFYKCMDLFLFTSIWENRPLSVIEAISNDLPVLMYNLDNYVDTFSKYELVEFLTKDRKSNIKKIKKLLNVE
jgi:glycosyltransferase involved in cell wall biosynthesis